MTAYRSLPTAFKRLFDTQKKRRWVGVIIALLLLFFLLKGSGSTPIDTTYRIAYDNYWEHINLMGQERNISAFSRDVLSAIAKEERKRISLIQVSSSEELYRGLRNHEFDGVLSTTTPTVINQTTMTFSKPYFRLGSVLVTRALAPAHGSNELSHKIVAVQSNSPSILELEKDPTIHVKLYDNILSALIDLDKGNIDGVFFPALQAHVYASTFYAGKLQIATSPLTEEGLRLVTLNNADGKELVEAFNDGLQTIKKNDVYDNLLHNWGLVNTDKLDDVNEKKKGKSSEEGVEFSPLKPLGLDFESCKKIFHSGQCGLLAVYNLSLSKR